jgi:hypothetical protein
MSDNLRPDGARFTALDLARGTSGATLDAVMRAGTAPAFASLSGWEWDGYNTTPLAGLVGIRKFRKGFYEGQPRAAGPEPFIQGYNIPVRRGPLEAPHASKPTNERPKRFAFFRVHPVVPGARDARYPNALLLDYGRGGNFVLDPAALLRDYLVQVYADDADLLLGRALAAVAGLRVHLSYFVLRRAHRHDFHGDG